LRGLILLSTFPVNPEYISPQLQRVCGNAQENPRISVLQMLCGNSQDNPRINPTAGKGFVEINSQDNPRIILMNPTTAYTGHVENFTRN